MGNPLLVFWHRMLLEPPSRRRPSYVDLVEEPTAATAPIFLVLRRMRAPLIVLILIFAISVIGLTLMPGQDASGQPHRLGFFDAFYFMNYTATTIGYGEIPYPFSTAQRMWVTFSIYLAVDDLLLAGRPAARRQLATTMLDEATAGYVLTGAATPTTWIGRALTRR
jgi:hypothetical protein